MRRVKIITIIEALQVISYAMLSTNLLQVDFTFDESRVVPFHIPEHIVSKFAEREVETI